ncbi:DNA-directed RNA polymerase subunit delta [Abyssicoccus albus]|uniref:DNA-directed RNA polymerase subunit delta n=1 Tax=Abyssicoccus albus TaxID=1817405 RepID=UPI00097E3773|nr:DNA-directed RNA polymerase subunit delta [Abyssicoccus albus]AQL55682.1 DNA-directed RNA polymerase subunit delta [Abyssicoccus albus]
MKIKDYTKEMINENSFIEMAYLYLKEKKSPQSLYTMIDEFKSIGGYTDEEIEDRVLQFYTNLNTDGRFLSVEEGTWGLRDWYSVDEIEENIAPTIQKFEIAEEDTLDDEAIDEEVESEDVKDRDGNFDEDNKDIDEDTDEYEDLSVEDDEDVLIDEEDEDDEDEDDDIEE